MKLSEVLKMELIEMYEEKYRHNKYILNTDVCEQNKMLIIVKRVIC